MTQLTTAKVQIYTGDGKGKTTAALGLMFRAHGYGLKSRMYQFVKKMHCSEHIAAEDLGFDIMQSKCADPLQAAKDILVKASEDLKHNRIDLLILDETGEAMRRGYVSRNDIEELLLLRPQTTEVVFTGRGLTEQIGDLADLITEMKSIKHYFDQGLLARKGIEY